MADNQPEHLNPLQRFGFEVKSVRRGRKITQSRLATGTGYSIAYVSKVESGKVMPSEKFARGCDHVFGTNGLFERLHPKGKEDHPARFGPYVDLERKATAILDYSSTLPMGMLQTPEYARAVVRASHPREEPSEIEVTVDARMGRRHVMEQKNPPLLWVILHEACLRTEVGGRKVLSGQLEFLLHLVKSPHITIQVLKFSAGAPPSHLPFTLLEQPDGSVALYSETQYRGHVADSEAAITEAQDAFDRLRAVALSPDDSLGFIAKLTEEYE
ncbi:helix-turn-helix domain-containing protein [Streptomyces sp. RGM 3693]|uniref:helix-turn-helix domain-containing protein n=1 Tax=Streptomyces sp. RGM 3693 TaxID=3413284 RepID=UPI003D27EE68